MAETQYTYKIVLDGTTALSQAITFKQRLEQELSKIQFNAQLNVGQLNAQLKGAAKNVTKAQASATKAALEATVKGFQRDVGRMAPKTFMAPMEGAIKKSLQAPSTRAIRTLTKLQAQIERTHEATAKMGVGIDEWAGAGGVERMAMALQAAQRRVWGIRGFGFQMQAYGRQMMGAGMAGMGGAAVAAREYLQFAEPLGRAARNLELNAQMTEYLDQKLRDMAGTASMFSPEEQAQQLYMWAAATGEVADSTRDINAVLERTSHVQKLAHLGMIGQAEAVETVTDIQSQYSLSVDQTENIVATLVKVAAVSKAEVSDLGAAFKYAGARAQAANTSFDETAAVLQLLSAFGMRGSMAGRGLARLLENLIAPSDAARGVLDELFETAFGRDSQKMLSTAEGQFVGLSEAIDILAQATENLTEMERQEFVGRITTQNAARVLIPLLEMQIDARTRNIDAIEAQQNILTGMVGQHEQAFIDMMADIYGYEISTKSATDTLNDQWTQFMDSVDGRTKRLKATFSGAMADLGKAVVEFALPHVENLARGFSNLVDTITETEGLIDKLIKTAGGLVAAGLGTMIAGGAIRLYADIKAVTMAANMRKTANDQLDASIKMMAAAQIQLRAANLQAGITGPAGAGQVTRKNMPGTVVSAPGRVMTGITHLVVYASSVVIGARIGAEIADWLGPKLWGTETWEGHRGDKDWTESALQTLTQSVDNLAMTFAMRKIDIAESMGYTDYASREQQELETRAGELMRKYYGRQTLGVERADEVSRVDSQRYAALAVQYRDIAMSAGEIAARNAMAKVRAEEMARAFYNLEPALLRILNLAELFAGSIQSTVGAFGVIADDMQRLLNIRGAGDVLFGTPTAEDLGQQARSAISGGWGRIRGLGGLISPDQMMDWGSEYAAGVQAIYTKMRDDEQWQIDLALDAWNQYWDEKVDTVRTSADEMTRLQEQAAKDAEQAYESYRTTLADIALAPSQVTAEDVWATSVGAYEEKPDEYIRQLRAAIEGSTEWEWMLPQGVKDADEEGRAAWFKQHSAAFYAGAMPEKVNWDAVQREIEQRAAAKQNREAFMDYAVREMESRGISMEREDIASLFGMDTPLERQYFGGMVPSDAGKQLNASVQVALQEVQFGEEGMAPTAESFVTTFSGGVSTEMTNVAWVDMMASAWSVDLDNNIGQVEAMGAALVPPLVTGMKEALGEISLVRIIVAIVLETLVEKAQR